MPAGQRNLAEKKPRRFNIGLTLADVNLIEEALILIGKAESDVSEAAKILRARIHSSVQKQLVPKKKPQQKPPKRDAMSRRLPGSFESTR